MKYENTNVPLIFYKNTCISKACNSHVIQKKVTNDVITFVMEPMQFIFQRSKTIFPDIGKLHHDPTFFEKWTYSAEVSY